MKTKIIFLSTIFILLAASVFAQKQDAAAAVNVFYKFHLTRSNIFKASEVKAYQKYFSADLNKLFQIELQREKEYLKKYPTDKPHFGDGFPFQPLDECDSAGKSVKNTYQIGAPVIKNERATVEVKFYEPKQCGGALITTYKVELVKVKNNWLIDDWLYADAKTLTEDLKRAEY